MLSINRLFSPKNLRLRSENSEGVLLMYCLSCLRDTTESAANCPHCGQEMVVVPVTPEIQMEIDRYHFLLEELAQWQQEGLITERQSLNIG